jgi:hypothetical protein
MYDARKTLVNVVSTLLAASGWTKVLSFNPKRIAIILSPVGATAITYSFSGNAPIPIPATPPGICVNQSNVLLKIADLGLIVQQDLYASDGGLGSTVAVTEILDPCWEGY